ncbi:hypothetical protein J5Y03_13350 [Bacillus sp. RG28]|uniref:Uncharacterized protein n=1 Tax=Gottfriedia endophytica TaxID=2820819 RepID=A0A940NWC4_9BACI|nr:hypothetical protein [Gottfriedia endophytica]MBP0726163.1 hypothetical protein [Gottfriedia endophytica]
MEVGFERKKRLKTSLILAIVIIVLAIAAYINPIRSSLNKFLVQKTKKVSTVTKTLTEQEIDQLETKQEKLSTNYDKPKTAWLHKEINDGAFLMRQNGYSYLLHHPEYDSAKIKYTVTKYTVDGKTVEFMSKSKIIQVHSKGMER